MARFGHQPTNHVRTAEIFAIGTLSDKAVSFVAKLDQIIQMIKGAFGRDLEHACASKGSISGRLHEVVTDVFSNSPLDTAECEGNNKLQADIDRNSNIIQPLLASRYSLQKQLTQRVAAIAHGNPTAKLQRCQLMFSRSWTRSTIKFAPKQT